MLGNPKYVVVDGCIIVFSPAMKHSQFEHMKPTSAGFISIGFDDNKKLTCTCYGESTSLKLKANVEEDTIKAKLQLNL